MLKDIPLKMNEKGHSIAPYSVLTPILLNVLGQLEIKNLPPIGVKCNVRSTATFTAQHAKVTFLAAESTASKKNKNTIKTHVLATLMSTRSLNTLDNTPHHLIQGNYKA